MSAPVLLIQWLETGEYRETRAVVHTFAGKHPEIDLHDVATKAQLVNTLELLRRDDDCQFLFIGAHGVKDHAGKCIGIGKSGTDYIPWVELWHAIRPAKKPPVLWLGACSSSRCADAWSPLPSTNVAVEWLVGFDKDVYPKEIEEVLKGLIRMTALDNITYADEEIPRLRKLIPGTCVQMHYPRYFNKQHRFLETSQFPAVFGKTFKEALEGK